MVDGKLSPAHPFNPCPNLSFNSPCSFAPVFLPPAPPCPQQFEDFQTEKAFEILHRQRDALLCFKWVSGEYPKGRGALGGSLKGSSWCCQNRRSYPRSPALRSESCMPRPSGSPRLQRRHPGDRRRGDLWLRQRHEVSRVVVGGVEFGVRCAALLAGPMPGLYVGWKSSLVNCTIAPRHFIIGPFPAGTRRPP